MTKTRAELANLMLRMLDRGWQPCDDVLCQVAAEFPDFHAAYTHYIETCREVEAADAAVSRERETLLKVAIDYTPPPETD